MDFDKAEERRIEISKTIKIVEGIVSLTLIQRKIEDKYLISLDLDDSIKDKFKVSCHFGNEGSITTFRRLAD